MQTSEAGKALFGGQNTRRRRSPKQRGEQRLLNGQALATAQRLSHPAARPVVFSVLLQVWDVCALMLSGYMVLALVNALQFQSFTTTQVAVLWLGALATLMVLRIARAYRFRRMRSLSAGALALAIGLAGGFALLVLTLAAAGWGSAAMERWLPLWAGLGATLMLAGRVLVWARIDNLTKTGRMEHRIVLVGSGPVIEPLIAELDRERRQGRRFCGYFDDRTGTRAAVPVAGYHRMGDLDDLVQFARLARIDTVIVAIPRLGHRRLMELLARLFVLPVDIRVLADAEIPVSARKGRYSTIGRFKLIDLHKRPIHGGDAVKKRIFDLVFASLLLILFAPVMALVALAVAVDSRGPILFRQKRHGFNNRPVEVLKFRTMYADRSDPSAVNAVRRGDPRVTRVGRFLRRCSLDELPQFLNVLRGELSLVGPRPHATAARTGDIMYDAVTEAYSARHKVRPGVTGWAQINGWRGELNSPEKIRARIEHDLYYIENWSLWLDLKILLRTPWALVHTKNAY